MDKCVKYSERAALCNQILNLKKSNHFYFKNVIVTEKPWNYKEFNGPPTNSFLKRYPHDFTFSFDENGCKDIAAFCVEGVVSSHCQFPQLDGNLICKSNFNENVKVDFCQDNCFKANEPLDVYFDKNLNCCKLVNLPKKIFCLKPSDDKSIPPLLWDQNLNKCSMSPQYCQYFGLSFNAKSKECFLPNVQGFFEKYMFGKTLIRSLLHPSLIFNHEITDHIIFPYSCDKKYSQFKTSKVERKLVEFTKDFIAGSTPEISLFVSNLSIQYLYKFTNNLEQHISKSIILLEINNIVTDLLLLNTLRILNVCSRVAGNWEVFIIYMLGAGLDILDTLKLNKALTSLEFNTLMNKFDTTFNDKVKEQTVTPENILNLEVMKLKLKKQISNAYYLKYGGIKNLLDIINFYMEDLSPSEKVDISYNKIFSHIKTADRSPEIFKYIFITLIIVVPLLNISLTLVAIIFVVTLLVSLIKLKS